MAEATLKKRVLTGLIWSFVQRFGTMGISFLSNIVLARLLTPEDFGTIGMLLIFVAISNTFIDGGFGSALIQKKKTTSEDFSTIFYWNIFVSIILTIILYYTAPLISDFYAIPKLTDKLRVMGIVLIINAFSVVQLNILHKELKFKIIAVINIVATTIASIIAIVCAYKGMGVWSLVIRNLLAQFLITFFVWITSHWAPILAFKTESFISLGKFGGMMLLANLTETIYNEVQGLIIGKAFSARALGYYTQARRLEEIPTSCISSALNQVSFPVFSSMQDRKDEMRQMVRANVQMVAFVVFPIYTLLIIVGKPLIILLFTDKWAESIPLFQILCFVGMVYPLNTINTNIIKSLGRGKLYFNLQFLKRLGGIALLISSISLGMLGLMGVMVLIAYLIFFVNAYFSQVLIGYRIKDQLGDITKSGIIAIITGFGIFWITKFNLSNNCIMLLQLVCYPLLYLVLQLYFNNSMVKYIFKIFEKTFLR